MKLQRLNMKNYWLLFLLTCLLLNLNANAHHDIPDELDLENPITITGKVIGVEWKNPHAILLINANTDSAGIKKLWTVLADTPSALLRRGLKRESFSAMSGVSLVIYSSQGNSCINCSGIGLNITDSFARTHLLSYQLQASLTELKFGK